MMNPVPASAGHDKKGKIIMSRRHFRRVLEPWGEEFEHFHRRCHEHDYDDWDDFDDCDYDDYYCGIRFRRG